MFLGDIFEGHKRRYAGVREKHVDTPEVLSYVVEERFQIFVSDGYDLFEATSEGVGDNITGSRPFRDQAEPQEPMRSNQG